MLPQISATVKVVTATVGIIIALLAAGASLHRVDVAIDDMNAHIAVDSLRENQMIELERRMQRCYDTDQRLLKLVCSIAEKVGSDDSACIGITR